MPLYQYANIETGEIEEHFVKIADAEAFLEANQHLRRMVSAPGLIDPVIAGRARPPDAFNEILKDVKKHHPLSDGVNAR